MKIVWSAEEAQKIADHNNAKPTNKPMGIVRVGYDRWAVVHADKLKYFHEWKDQ